MRETVPPSKNHSKNTAVYRIGRWKFEIVYADGVAKKLTVTKIDSMTDEEIHSVLMANAEGAAWREIELSGETRMWQRSDLATARLRSGQAACHQHDSLAVSPVQGSRRDPGARDWIERHECDCCFAFNSRAQRLPAKFAAQSGGSHDFNVSFCRSGGLLWRVVSGRFSWRAS